MTVVHLGERQEAILSRAIAQGFFRSENDGDQKVARALNGKGFLDRDPRDGMLWTPTDAARERMPEVVPGLLAHPFADLFPMIEGDAFADLVEDIRQNGVREPVVLLGGRILDGRNRYRAGVEAGFFTVSPMGGYPRPASSFVIFEKAHPGVDPLAWVISKNLRRRHLTDDQRRMVAARLATFQRGDAKTNAANGGIARKQAAAMLSVDEAGVERARTVIARGTEELQQAVERNEVTVRMAADLASLPPEQQRDIIVRSDPKALRAVVRELRDKTTADKKDRRAAREVALAEKIEALPSRRYGVILADPEWRFEPYSRETGLDRAPDNHYPTTPTADIALRDVASIAAPDCVLFLWATPPMLPDALRVIAGWGFAYKTHAIWAKVRAGDGRGTGYWFLGEHELLIVATRGNVPAPALGTQWRSVFFAPVGEHSAKPEESLVLIETYFPNLPKIELNRRGPARPGWDAWGLEAGNA